MTSPTPAVLECTLRDSSYAVEFQFTAAHTAKIARALEDAGFDFIEIGHGLGLGASTPAIGVAAETDEAYLEAAATSLTRAKWGTFFIPGIARAEHLDLAGRYRMPFVRFGTNVTEYEMAAPFITHARRYGMGVAVNLMKTYAVDLPEFRRIVREIGRWEPDVIYVVDSAGYMDGEHVRQCVRAVLDETSAQAGFHAHHNLQLAVSNSLIALAEGAMFVDSTLRGVGRSAGNAQTEVLVALMQRQGLLPGIDLMKTVAVARDVFVPTLQEMDRQVPGLDQAELWRGVSPVELVTGLSKCHSSFLPMITKVAGQEGVDLLGQHPFQHPAGTLPGDRDPSVSATTVLGLGHAPWTPMNASERIPQV